MIYCDQCGAANRPTARFCRVCGGNTTPLVPPSTGVSPGSTSYHPRQPGSVLASRYQITTLIGRGGMGAVYRALDSKFRNRGVAIKEMIPEPGVDPRAASPAFEEEAMLLASLMHPSLPRIYDYFEESGNFFLVMDFIEGQTLENHLEQNGGKIDPREALDLAIKLCQVLAYLHEQTPPIIFRDLKPANIMLDRSGQPYLIDFGIARLFKPGQVKDTTAIGSIGYAPPEQYGKSQTDARSDLYALATVLWQAITGDDPADTPFRFKSVEETNHPASSDLEELLKTLHDPDPNKRPAQAALVQATLMDIRNRWGTITPALPVSKQSALPRRAKPTIAPPFPGGGPQSSRYNSYRAQQPITDQKTLVILSVEKDRPLEKELRTYLTGAFRGEPMTILTKEDDMKPGAPIRRTWDEWLSSADIVLALMDSDFLSNDEFYERYLHARYDFKCLAIPIWVRHYPREERDRGYCHDGIVGAPRKKPITEFRPREGAYQEIAEMVREVVTRS